MDEIAEQLEARAARLLMLADKLRQTPGDPPPPKEVYSFAEEDNGWERIDFHMGRGDGFEWKKKIVE